jgi:hypothetical protein
MLTSLVSDVLNVVGLPLVPDVLTAAGNVLNDVGVSTAVFVPTVAFVPSVASAHTDAGILDVAAVPAVARRPGCC